MDTSGERGVVWTPPVTVERTEDGRRAYVVDGTRYTEVPLGAGDAYRFLAELRLEMTGPEFRAFIERHRPSLSGAILWRLGLGPIPFAPEEPQRLERTRAKLRPLVRAA